MATYKDMQQEVSFLKGRLRLLYAGFVDVSEKDGLIEKINKLNYLIKEMERSIGHSTADIKKYM